MSDYNIYETHSYAEQVLMRIHIEEMTLEFVALVMFRRLWLVHC